MNIKITGNPGHMQFGALHRCREYLHNFGYDICTSKPDILLIHTYRRDRSAILKDVSLGIPCIILERVAASHIMYRECLDSDNVIAIAKESCYRDFNINNSVSFEGRYHLYLVALANGMDKQYPNEIRKHEYPITKKQYEKIELWYNFEAYDMMFPIISNSINFKDTRKNDVTFYGTTKYGSKSLSFHRQQCINQMQKLKNCILDVSDRRVLSRNNYWNSLYNSKISVSPWGLGAKCYRDFESVYAGCIVIKPDTSFVKDRCDFYNLENKFYVPCKVDYSDLQEKVDWIKSEWKNLEEIRINNRQKLIHQFESKQVAMYLRDLFKRCAEKIK